MPTLSRTINRQQLTFNKRKGFTIIELLIAIAVISILAGIGAMVYPGTQKKARDAQRKNDLIEMKKALELAKYDCLSGAYYPILTTGGTEAARFSWLGNNYLGPNGRKLMGSVPADPKGNPGYGYTTTVTVPNVCPNTTDFGLTIPGATNFVLRAKLEQATFDPDSTKSYNNCFNKMSGMTFDSLPDANDGYYYVCND